MSNTYRDPYETAYHFVLNCGSVHNQRDFTINVLHNLANVCPYDQGRIYFYNGNSKVSSQYLIGVDKKWATAYHEYYSKILNQQYSLRLSLNEKQFSPDMLVRHNSWKNAEDNEFVKDYIRPQGLKYSLSFTLFDTHGFARATIMMDRTRKNDYTLDEMELLRLIYPQINNLHKNFFSLSRGENQLENVDWKTTNLTDREIEVTILICRGISPSNISKKLNIALPTVYKHISHIYSKMQVSSRQELLVRILNQQ